MLGKAGLRRRRRGGGRFVVPSIACLIAVASLGSLTEAEPEDAPSPIPAEDPAGRAADAIRLQRIQQEIEELRGHILEAESTAGSILDQLDEIDLKIALLRREVLAVETQTESAEQAYQTADQHAADLRQELAASEDAVRLWLQEIYKAGPTHYLRVVAASTSPAEVASAQRAVETLSLMESERIEKLRDDRTRLEAALEELATTRESLGTLRRELEGHQADLLERRREKALLLAQIRDEQATQEAILKDLVQVENELRALLTSLRAGEGDQTVSRGFARFHGLLDPPAAGPLLVPFGNVRHPRFQTEVPHPGIDLATESGGDVTAVFDGLVLFSSWFRGYGQLIVLDHADGYLSIYGHLAERLVEVGHEVYGGDVIARSGEGGPLDTPSLYFEIRHDGEPQDPLPWLRPSSGGSHAGTRSKP